MALSTAQIIRILYKSHDIELHICVVRTGPRQQHVSTCLFSQTC